MEKLHPGHDSIHRRVTTFIAKWDRTIATWFPNSVMDKSVAGSPMQARQNRIAVLKPRF
jgi:hypothetical protein